MMVYSSRYRGCAIQRFCFGGALFIVTTILLLDQASAYTDKAIALVNQSYNCMSTGACKHSYQNCYDHTHLEPNLSSEFTPERSCRTMLTCHRECQNRVSKAETLACNQRCNDKMDSNAILLYDVLQQCFARWCPNENDAQECHGWSTKEECEASASCYFFKKACSSTDTSAPKFVNCPAKDIVVNTLSTADTGIARWANLRAIDRGISTTWVQVDGDHESGNHFPMGTTQLHFRSYDDATPTPNFGDCKFTVVVKDGWPPSFTHCPKDFDVYPHAEEFFVDEEGSYMLNVTWVTPTAFDYVGFSFDEASPTVNWKAVPIGSTTIKYTAIDDAGLTDTCIFTVTVATPFLFYFDHIQERRPQALDYSVASVAFDLNRGYSAVQDLLEQGSIIVRFFGVEVNGCAQRCYARANASESCVAFLFSRDGNGKCYLLSSQITNATEQLEYDPSWDTFTVRWAGTTPVLEDNFAYCPGAAAASDCSQKSAGSSDCVFAQLFDSCVQTAFDDGCNSAWALRLQNFRSQVLANNCSGTATPPTHPTSEDASSCGTYAFAQCVHCCKNTTSPTRCKISYDGVSREADNTCAEEQYTSRLACATSCFSNSSSDTFDEATPDYMVDVALEFVTDDSLSNTGSIDKAEEATWLIAVSEALNVTADNIAITAKLTNDSKTKLSALLRVAEDDILPAQPPGDEALWNYIVLETVTWKTLIGEDMALASSDLQEYIDIVEQRVRIATEALRFKNVAVSDVTTNVNVSSTFNTRVVTAPPTPAEDSVVQTSTFTTTTMFGNGDVSASGSDNNDSSMSGGLVAVIAITVVFILLVALTIYLCMVYKDRKVKVHPNAPSFSAPAPVHSLPPGAGMRPPSMVRRSQILNDPDPFLDSKTSTA